MMERQFDAVTSVDGATSSLFTVCGFGNYAEYIGFKCDLVYFVHLDDSEVYGGTQFRA